MKKSLLIGTVIILILVSCEKVSINQKQYLFKTNNGIEYKYSDFELYDSSTHILYLKTKHPVFNNENSSTFSLLADGEEIYNGVFWPPSSSSLPNGPYISSSSFYPDFVIRIENMTLDNEPIDPRNDPRIITALEEQIDKLVYQLYNLTAEEINIIENI